MKQSKWGKVKEKLSDIFQFLVVIIIVVFLLAALIAPYLAVGEAISEGDLPWWSILLIR
jgi:hypothetical protein